MIGKKRWNILTSHLVELEKRTGTRLLTASRYSSKVACPISSYAPEIDRHDCTFQGVSCSGNVHYNDGINHYDYSIYSNNDSEWWSALSVYTKRQVHNALKKWIKERYEAIDNATGTEKKSTIR